MLKYPNFYVILSIFLLSSCSKTNLNTSLLDSATAKQVSQTEFPYFPADNRISDFSSNKPAFKLLEIGNNLSGITWDPYSKQYLAIQNNSAIIYRYDHNFNFLGKVKKVGKIHNDTEGISYFDQSSLLIATEANVAHKIKLNLRKDGNGYFNSVVSFRLSNRPLVKNKGLEAITFRPSNSQRDAEAFAAQEGSGRSEKAQMKVFSFNPMVESSMLGNQFGQSDATLKLLEPFSAEQKLSHEISDISGMTFDPTGETLIILSQESKKALQVVPETGEILSILNLRGLPVYEGVTIGPLGELVFVSERNWVQIYTKNENSSKD